MLFKPAMESRVQEGVQPINDDDHVFSGVFAGVDDGAVPKPGDVSTTEAVLSVVQTLDNCLLTHPKPVAHVSHFHDSITVEGESSVNAKNEHIPNLGVIGSRGVNMTKSPNVIEAFVNLKNEAQESKDGKGSREKLLNQTKCYRGKQIAEQPRNMKTAILSTIRQNMDSVDQLFDVHIMALEVGKGNRAGGLALFWYNTLDLTFASFSSNHIDVIVSDAGLNIKWHLTEKQGGIAKSDRSMQAFRDVCNHCGFTDMGFKGYPFTWNNGQHDQHNIQERLDRVFATEEWLLKFPYTKVNHISRFTSDHCDLEISFDSLPPSNHTRRQQLFRFEEAWCLDERCKDVINAV
ncbi:ribonuclease H [Senna tora]|uniref:Ribonuclease H n=1 Tax=Senna tora TaxID=362788 RepID=A0A834TH82_9FABA|nr:ribonuclease H [Senna tora]